MADLELTMVQKLYLEALKEGPQESSKLVNMVKNKLTELKGGNNPVGATARSQAVSRLGSTYFVLYRCRKDKPLLVLLLRKW
jgi:hypothetical protein